MVIKSNEKSYFDDAPARLRRPKFWVFRQILCMGHENFTLLNWVKDPKKSCSTQKNFIQKGQIKQKKRWV